MNAVGASSRPVGETVVGVGGEGGPWLSGSASSVTGRGEVVGVDGRGGVGGGVVGAADQCRRGAVRSRRWRRCGVGAVVGGGRRGRAAPWSSWAGDRRGGGRGGGAWWSWWWWSSWSWWWSSWSWWSSWWWWCVVVVVVGGGSGMLVNVQVTSSPSARVTDAANVSTTTSGSSHDDLGGPAVDLVLGDDPRPGRERDGLLVSRERDRTRRRAGREAARRRTRTTRRTRPSGGSPCAPSVRRLGWRTGRKRHELAEVETRPGIEHTRGSPVRGVGVAGIDRVRVRGR